MTFKPALRFIAVASILFAAAASADDRPNILLILTDDQGYADVGFNGGKDVKTPNLDDLAAQGMTFSQAYVPHPFCGPSRAGLMTGRYPHKIGAQFNLPEDGSYNGGVPRSEVFFSKVLQDADYYTGAIGKWHLGNTPEFHPNERGFDDYYGFLGGGHKYFPEQYKKEYEARVAQGAAHIWEYLTPLEHNGVEVDETEYVTDGLSREAVRFINDAASDDKPFFLYLAYNAPHTPLEAKDDDLALFEDIKDDKRRTYAAMVYAVDRGVGRIVEALRETGQLDNTLIVFLSDNGGRLDEGGNNYPLRAGKGSVHEGGYRSPMFMHWPGTIKGGSRYDYPVHAFDFYPTFAGLANATVPQGKELDGKNIWQDILAGENAREGEVLYALRHRRGLSDAAARRDEWKAVRTGNGPWKLFDIEKDIHEDRDLAASNPGVLKELVAGMAEWGRDHVQPLFFHIPQEGELWREHEMPRFHETFAMAGSAPKPAAPRPPAANPAPVAKPVPVAAPQFLPMSDPRGIGGWEFNERFSDEFNGTELDRDKWIVQGENGKYYTWRGRAPSQFAPHNVRVEDGKLKLRSQWEPEFEFSDTQNNDAWYGKHEGEPLPVTTAGVITRDRFLHGYMEARTKAGDAAMTSAFWTIGYQSEIDIYEQMGNPKRQGLIAEKSYIYNVFDWRPPVVRPNKVWTDTEETLFRVADEFHVYGCEWGEDYLKFYLDGELIREVTREEVGERWTLTNPMEIWFDSEIFYWLGMPHEEELPVDFEIDYVRVWQQPQPSLIDRAFFGFEGPIIVPEFRPAIGEPRAQGWKESFERYWFIDNKAKAHLSISEENRVTGRKALKFESTGRLGSDAVAAFSPPGSVDLARGDYVLAMNVWIAPESTVSHAHIVLEDPWAEVAFPLDKVDRGKWVTIYQRLSRKQSSSPNDRLRLAIRNKEVGSGNNTVYFDNLLLIENP